MLIFVGTETHFIPVIGVWPCVIFSWANPSKASRRYQLAWIVRVVVHEAWYDAAGTKEEKLPDLIADLCDIVSCCQLIMRKWYWPGDSYLLEVSSRGSTPSVPHLAFYCP
jgi:hypothetical protein